MFFSIVIATHNRLELLKECIESIMVNTFNKYEIIIAHSGINDGTKEYIEKLAANDIHYLECKKRGAAAQRNEGVKFASGDWIVFLDDDVVLEPLFLEELYKGIISEENIRGVCGSIVNQYYSEPSALTKILLKLSGIDSNENLSGKVRGPALNFLPRKDGENEEYVEWMPTCVCAYHKQTIEEIGGFPDHFVGYSFGEDLYLSMKVAEKHPIKLIRKARLYHHDKGSTTHKNYYKISKMQTDNRNFINRNIIKQNKFLFNIRLMLWNNVTSLIQFLKGNISIKNYVMSVAGYNSSSIKNSLF